MLERARAFHTRAERRRRIRLFSLVPVSRETHQVGCAVGIDRSLGWPQAAVDLCGLRSAASHSDRLYVDGLGLSWPPGACRDHGGFPPWLGGDILVLSVPGDQGITRRWGCRPGLMGPDHHRSHQFGPTPDVGSPRRTNRLPDALSGRAPPVRRHESPLGVGAQPLHFDRLSGLGGSIHRHPRTSGDRNHRSDRSPRRPGEVDSPVRALDRNRCCRWSDHDDVAGEHPFMAVRVLRSDPLCACCRRDESDPCRGARKEPWATNPDCGHLDIRSGRRPHRSRTVKFGRMGLGKCTVPGSVGDSRGPIDRGRPSILGRRPVRPVGPLPDPSIPICQPPLAAPFDCLFHPVARDAALPDRNLGIRAHRSRAAAVDHGGCHGHHRRACRSGRRPCRPLSGHPVRHCHLHDRLRSVPAAHR